jgi:hypothetical protein
LTTQMNSSTQSAQPWRSLYFAGITTAYFWGWGHNIHCGVFLHLLGKVDIDFPVGRHSWNWRNWFGGVQLKHNKGKDRTQPWKVLSRTLSVYWTQMLWNSCMIPWLASVYSAWELFPRRSTDVEQWNGWR